MTYSDKVKQAKTIINAINDLKDKESIKVSYGSDYDGMPVVYRITANTYGTGTTYSIYKDDVFVLSGMNISDINKTTMDAYTYDMMGQRTTYRFPLYEMKIVGLIFNQL